MRGIRSLRSPLAVVILVGAVIGTGSASAVDTQRNAIGRLSSVGHPTPAGSLETRTFYEYDAYGRAVGTQYVQDGQSRVFTTQYGYPQTTSGPGTTIISQTFPDGEEVSYTYDASGQQIIIRSKFGGVTEDVVRDVRFNPRGQMARIAFGNGTLTTFEYEETGHLRLRRLTTTNATGQIIQDLSYTYDASGNVTGTANGVRADQSITLEYDPLGQLTNVNNSAGSVLERYTYDAIGNLVRKGYLTQEYNAGGRPHALARSSGIDYGYDSNGNVTSLGNTTIEWDSQNLPVRVRTAGAVVTEKSFGGGTLWKKVEQGVTTYYLPAMRVENGMMRKYYGNFAERVEQPGDRRLRFYHSDHLGSSSAMTDHSGAPIRRVSYLPWGQDRDVEPEFVRPDGTKVPAFTPKLQFNFKEKDATGFYDYGARLYNPVTGRWLSPDSSTADGMNRYAYVRNNPWSKIDPSGNRSCCDPEEEGQDQTRKVTPADLPNETLEQIDDGINLVEEYLNELESYTDLDAWWYRIPFRYVYDEGTLRNYQRPPTPTEANRHLSRLVDQAIAERDAMAGFFGYGEWTPASQPVLYLGTGNGDVKSLLAKAKRFNAAVVYELPPDATDRDIYTASRTAFRKVLEARGTVIMDLRESGGKYWVYEATLARRFARICGACKDHIIFLTPDKPTAQ